MLLYEVFLLICTLFLAGKDATSYLLKDKNRPENSLDTGRIKRWHRDGLILNALFVLPLVYFTGLWQIVVYAGLIRLAFFDVAFNKWAGLGLNYLGSTATIDKIFIKIFGKNGAILKSLAFLVILII